MGKWFIAEWREAWRFSSLWVGTIAIGALTVWNLMPPAVQDVVPDAIELTIGAALWGLLILSRLIRQPDAEAAIKASQDDYSEWADRARG